MSTSDALATNVVLSVHHEHMVRVACALCSFLACSGTMHEV